jgi:hypothetical protein
MLGLSVLILFRLYSQSRRAGISGETKKKGKGSDDDDKGSDDDVPPPPVLSSRVQPLTFGEVIRVI